ncbi:hypothetical protein [Bacillus pumilus]|uniref:hypothetical protein n=1 Tax=Bacillus pumilus TaxID=1408 RepID=UPI00119FD235|nr:hypothetical protein [Bacillus pumilus]
MNFERFTDYYQKKMKYNLHINKRLQAVSDYFHHEHAITTSFSSKDNCFAYIVRFIQQHEDNAENILEELYNILEYPYSSQNLYFINKLETSVQKDDFVRNIKRVFGNEIIFEDFTYNLRDDVEYDANDEIIQCNLNYEESIEDYSVNEIRRKSLGTIKITFDLKNKKFFSSESPNEKSHKNIIDYLLTRGYTISPFYILKRAVKIKNNNFTDFSPTTLLIINLLLGTLPSLEYRVTLDSINFTNTDSQDIQRMTLNGTDLLSSNEVLQRIHNGDTVHTLKVSLAKIHSNNDSEVYHGASFKIDLRGKLSFIFGDGDDNEVRNREICIHIQNSLMDLIYADDTVQKGVSLIADKLPKPKTFNEIVSIIQAELLEIIENEADKVAIEKYFVEKYAIATL